MAQKYEKTIAYFESKGEKNTEDLVRIVVKRLEEGDVTAVAVATTSGRTAVTFAKAVDRRVPVYGVNFQNREKLAPELKKEGEEAGAVFMPDEPVARYIREVPGHSADSFRCFGQGMKVAVEVVMQAVEVGHIKAGEKVIGVGGTSWGADVAIVAKAAGGDNLSGLWVSEILAKPL